MFGDTWFVVCITCKYVMELWLVFWRDQYIYLLYQMEREKKISYKVCLDWAYFCWNWKHCSEIIFKCVNSVVGPIFNKKKLMKSVICGTVNSARMHCSQLTKSTIAGWTKKKIKKRNAAPKRRRTIQTVTQSLLKAWFFMLWTLLGLGRDNQHWRLIPFLDLNLPRSQV